MLQAQVWLQQYTLAGNTTGICGVAAEAVEFPFDVHGDGRRQFASPSVSALVLSYSGLGLLSLLNSSKIHSSNNNIVVVLVQLHLYHHALSSFGYSVPISIHSLAFSTLSALSIPHAAHTACACSSSCHTRDLRI